MFYRVLKKRRLLLLRESGRLIESCHLRLLEAGHLWLQLLEALRLRLLEACGLRLLEGCGLLETGHLGLELLLEALRLNAVLSSHHSQ